MSSEKRVEAAELYEEALNRRAEGNITGAFARYRRVLEIAEELQDDGWKAEILAELGRMYQENYDVLSARRWHGEALALFRKLEQGDRAGLTLFHSAQVEQLAGDTAAAEKLYHEALEEIRKAGDARTEGLARACLGQLLWEMKREAEGVPELVTALRLLQDCGAPESDAVREQIRSWSRRVGPVRYRQLFEAATDDPALRASLLD